MNYTIEYGQLFRQRETIQGESESSVREHLMRTRPEIFPVQITPELSLEPRYQDAWHQREGRDVPFTCAGGGR